MSGKKKSNIVVALIFGAIAVAIFLSTILLKGGMAA